MDIATAIGSVFAAFGLSGAAGLNAWIPLFATGLLDRVGVIDLSAPYSDLSSTPALIIMGAALVLDFVGDKVPTVDHVLHVAGTVIAPVSGAVVFVAQTGTHTDIPPVAALLVGSAVSGSFHAGRAALRPVSTATTAGAGNPILSLIEDVGSVVLTALAVLAPLLAFLLVLAVLVALAVSFRTLRRRWRARRAAKELAASGAPPGG
jgi:Domain of unknown function (DUF4126)